MILADLLTKLEAIKAAHGDQLYVALMFMDGDAVLLKDAVPGYYYTGSKAYDDVGEKSEVNAVLLDDGIK